MNERLVLLEAPLSLHHDGEAVRPEGHQRPERREHAAPEEELGVAEGVLLAGLAHEGPQQVLGVAPGRHRLLLLNAKIQDPELIHEGEIGRAVREAVLSHLQGRDDAAADELLQDEGAAHKAGDHLGVGLDAPDEEVAALLEHRGEGFQLARELLADGELAALGLPGEELLDVGLAGALQHLGEVGQQGVLGLGEEVAHGVEHLARVVLDLEALVVAERGHVGPLSALGLHHLRHHLWHAHGVVGRFLQLPVQEVDQVRAVLSVDIHLVRQQLHHPWRCL
mmetsp:Transcript_116515/g.340911  ORF Transcript_116515/g.340911 Transcript_116515/m.340911 type:complete len:280 (+) Transcript_116515:1495-2334(+)